MAERTHDERVHEILYSCDDRQELAERIVKLEEFAADTCNLAEGFYNLGGTGKDLKDMWAEAKELGLVEVADESHKN